MFQLYFLNLSSSKVFIFTHTHLTVHLVGVDTSQLGLVVTHLLQAGDAQLVHSWLQLLENKTKND